jgi:transcriptional regulator with XRE-family HTH domain
MNSKDFKKLLITNPRIKKAFADAEKNEAYQMGRKIKELRIKNGWTQKEFGKKIGTKQPGIARMENGGEYPNNTTLLKIATVTKVTFIQSHFLEDSNNKEKSSLDDVGQEATATGRYWGAIFDSSMTSINSSSFKEKPGHKATMICDAQLSYCQ